MDIDGRIRELQERKKRKARRWLYGLLILIFLNIAAAVGTGVYIKDYYAAEEDAWKVLETPPADVTVFGAGTNQITFVPEECKTGLIFYPGGKVQFEAYAPLMARLAQEGILCVMVHMPGNLAVLNINAANGIQQQWPEIEQWWIGGHSLGGAMAASYLKTHAEEYEGLLLCAAFSTSDLSETDLEIISVYGSEDGVLNRDKYLKCKDNLPENVNEYVIEGGCHAGFGSYGEQKGDKDPLISGEEQIDLTAEFVSDAIGL